MSNPREIFRKSRNNIRRLGLTAIPFTESPIDLESQTLTKIFTGRAKELGQVFNQFQEREL